MAKTRRNSQTTKPNSQINLSENQQEEILQKASKIDESLKEKETALYSSLVQAWIGTKMEKDKSLLTLSSFGIGLVGTILTAVGVNSLFEIFVYGIIILCFLTTIISSILIFEKNAQVLKKEIDIICSKSNETSSNKLLGYLDKIMFWSFILGLIIFLFIGVSSSYSRLNKGDKINEPKEQQSVLSNSSNIIR